MTGGAAPPGRAATARPGRPGGVASSTRNVPIAVRRSAVRWAPQPECGAHVRSQHPHVGSAAADDANVDVVATSRQDVEAIDVDGPRLRLQRARPCVRPRTACGRRPSRPRTRAGVASNRPPGHRSRCGARHRSRRRRPTSASPRRRHPGWWSRRPAASWPRRSWAGRPGNEAGGSRGRRPSPAGRWPSDRACPRDRPSWWRAPGAPGRPRRAT